MKLRVKEIKIGTKTGSKT